jgi:hypothetical protein
MTRSRCAGLGRNARTGKAPPGSTRTCSPKAARSPHWDRERNGLRPQHMLIDAPSTEACNRSLLKIAGRVGQGPGTPCSTPTSTAKSAAASSADFAPTLAAHAQVGDSLQPDQAQDGDSRLRHRALRTDHDVPRRQEGRSPGPPWYGTADAVPRTRKRRTCPAKPDTHRHWTKPHRHAVR